MTTVPIALIQTRTPAGPAAAFAHVEPMIREAAAGGAKLVLTPEATNFLIRDRVSRDAVLETQDADAVIGKLRDLARELGVWLLIGSAIVKSGHDGDDRAANRSLLVDDHGGVVATYDKLHVYDVDLPTGERWRESAAIRPGDGAVIADTPWGRLGLTICYDIRFPQLYRALAKAGAVMIAVPAAFTVPTGEAHWETLLRARAIETGCYVLAPAQAGEHEDGRRTWGRSMVVAPWGEVLARLDDDEPGVLFATLDLEAVAKARAAVPQLTHDREFAAPA
ncbi:MAG: carbon-nitrogen hydrolase family protein [Alphaproteobacteria bacterium]|nr:carbon-nitrogen hydrolase family protein [Alphaproteobacteria bacterium]MBU2270456.1 carbon-nitrogen hydrolase family protein [Alphaproteobacteria bacterium]MBU2419432.1 carbon-nitrogen hydrolase family protein [Alphaproteobacteria bacterium]